ncbi:hypothetical protein Poli38472_004776 [Pythium oligandrum]|uniref:START domain-containing protein n=1 Tax=Pythium oligandrum TaxID=41045 RepID=A0A8K1CAQ8_PYTOL|nr:hypothetical protein Poli38472_004776 [Pythium oligandrum]|eukprot:TMW59707.1 hypothetical protein Poli38472_004776 [Pythium oligandrum]
MDEELLALLAAEEAARATTGLWADSVDPLDEALLELQDAPLLGESNAGLPWEIGAEGADSVISKPVDDLQTSSESTSDVGSTVGDSSNANSPVRTTYQRRKAERLYLRQKVSELEKELHALKQRGSSEREDDNASEPANGSDVTVAVATFWQRMAKRQQEQRQRSIAENLRLKDLLEGQIKLAKELELMLSKRSESADKDTDELLCPARKRARLDVVATPFAELMESFDERYTQLELAWKASGLDAKKTTFQTVQVRPISTSPDDADWYLVFLDSRVLPFDPALTREVAWRSLNTPRIELEKGFFETVEFTADVVKARGVMAVHLRHAESTITSQLAMRRYLDDDTGRSVFVWSVSSRIEGGVLKQRVVTVVEDGWTLIEPVPETSYSIVQACGHIRSDVPAETDRKWRESVGLLTDVSLAMYHQNLSGMFERMEGMLMQESQTYQTVHCGVRTMQTRPQSVDIQDNSETYCSLAKCGQERGSRGEICYVTLNY